MRFGLPVEDVAFYEVAPELAGFAADVGRVFFDDALLIVSGGVARNDGSLLGDLGFLSCGGWA